MSIQLSRKEIIDIYRQGEDAVVSLIEILINKINALEEEVAKLKAQSAKDSHNSSKPPSSDINRPIPGNLRKKSGRKSGGQPGHKGYTLKQVENPDHIIKYPLKGKCNCGRDIENSKLLGYEKRQVIDIPPIKMEVTEHQAETRECACGLCHTAQFPDDVEAPVQYGKRIRAIMLYFSSYQLVPQKRTTEAMSDLFGITLSQGTLNNILQKGYERLAKTDDAIKEAIRAAPVINCDETGMYVRGKRWWEHSCSTDQFTYYYCHKRRGYEAMEDGGILPGYTGRAIHDAWPSYFNFDMLNGLCNAHHLRELIFMKEHFKQAWAQEMIDHLCYIKKKVERAKACGRKHLSGSTLQRYMKKYKKIISSGYRANPPPELVHETKKRGRKKQTPALNLLDRLSKYTEETLAFMYDFNVPFDNNLSERDLRMTKVKQKISGCFRSSNGADIFCRIRSYISTVRKHGKNVFDYLIKCFDTSVTETVLIPE